MEFLHLFLSLLVLFLGLAVFANKFRRPDRIQFELTPNCLLTRWPVVFVTGPRSLFYFSRYWNLYPVYLAEHGYEVFTVHLPWHSSPARRRRFKEFLQAHKNKKYHFVMDSVTLLEMKDLLWTNPTAVTVSEITNAGFTSSLANFQFRPLEMTATGRAGFLLKLSFWLHRLFVKNPLNPALDTLGALESSAMNNSRLLLSRMQELAEEDYQEEEASP